VLVELGESGVVGEDWFVGGLEGEEAHECAIGQGSMSRFEWAVARAGTAVLLARLLVCRLRQSAWLVRFE
jgi:hypothetical protein